MLHRPDTKAVEAIVVVGGIDSSAIEVQVVAVRLRVERRTPVVAVGAPVVETRPVAVARRGEVRQTYFFLECPEKLTTIRAVYCSENVGRLSPDTSLWRNAGAQATASLCFFTPPTEA